MIIVTGGAGFIGSNIVHTLNARGETDIIVVDDLSDGRKFYNIVDAEIADYVDLAEFRERFSGGRSFGDVTCVFHQGACSDTTEWDGKYLMDNNYAYSCELLWYCNERNIPFIYASSAATYGSGDEFTEDQTRYRPVNLYGYSKWLFDQYVERHAKAIETQIAGLRYFNVYGPNEHHKDAMASVAFHFNNQIRESGTAKLFVGSDGYGNGEQRRDFVHVDDVVSVNLWLAENPAVTGIFNVGTGNSQTFNDVANAVIKWHGRGEIKYIPFPEKLKGHYQSFTEANLDRLREAGYAGDFMNVEQGVAAYLDQLNARNRASE